MIIRREIKIKISSTMNRKNIGEMQKNKKININNANKFENLD